MNKYALLGVVPFIIITFVIFIIMLIIEKKNKKADDWIEINLFQISHIVYSIFFYIIILLLVIFDIEREIKLNLLFGLIASKIFSDIANHSSLSKFFNKEINNYKPAPKPDWCNMIKDVENDSLYNSID